MHLDTTTRKELKEIGQAGRFVSSLAATIRAVVGKYTELLRLQKQIEEQGGQVWLLVTDASGEPQQRVPMQFRL